MDGFNVGMIRSAIVAIVVAILSAPVACPAGSQSHPLNEDAALDLLQRTLKRDSVYEKRIAWDCISYGTEETIQYLETAIHAVYPPNRHLSPKVRIFVDFLKARFGSNPHWDGTA